MKRAKNISEIIRQFYSQNKLSGKEIKLLEKWLESYDDSTEIETWLSQKWAEAPLHDMPVSLDELWAKIKIQTGNDAPQEKQLFHNYTPLNKRAKLIAKFSVAASVTIILMAGVFAYYAGFYLLQNTSTENIKYASVPKKEIGAVVLTIGENKEYKLNEKPLQLLKGSVKIEGNSNQLIMSKSQNQDKIKHVPIKNTIDVPYCKDYFIELSDGTKVWLNAGSKLVFPDYFEKNGRHVELFGEAYFEVKSDITNPFYVKTIDTEVMVTGTSFNVCDYNTDKNSVITLVEGKVNVRINETTHVLKPGEQLKLSKSERQVQINQVETELYTSWKDGQYIFKDVQLVELTERLRKWYDVDFIFENPAIEKLRFTGMVKKEKSADYFLKVLENTTNIHFTINKDNVIIQEIHNK